MTPYYVDEAVTLYHGDALAVLAQLPDASVDAVVTDPPYGLEFMGRDWDRFDPPAYQRWCWLWAFDCLRVLKPGGHLLAFGGTRTSHRLTCAIEDAGFEIRDEIAWLYGSGFPKSLDVSKAIDKAAGAEREVVGAGRWTGRESATDLGVMNDDAWQGGAARTDTAPATDDAARWSGWGTALKPAHEPIVVARKPLAGTVAANVLAHGTGALNVDGCRVGTSGGSTIPSGMDRLNAANAALGYRPSTYAMGTPAPPDPAGRWPSNVVLDEFAAAELDRQSGTLHSQDPATRAHSGKGKFDQDGWRTERGAEGWYGDTGGASRFFPVFRYEPKAPTTERPRDGAEAHPTVKPLDLMRWLVRLVTPPGGLVLDPFAGSGTTAEACVVEGFRCVAVEKHGPYLPLIVARLAKPIQPVLIGEGA